jgi:hypothetical protein
MSSQTIQILQSAQITGSLKFVGANSVGPQLTMILDSVLLTPGATLGMIHDEWGQLTLEGEVLVNISTGSFGTIVHPDGSVISPNVDEYYIGKGAVSWKELTPVADTNYIDIGNVPIFEFTPEIKRVDHFSSRLGVKTKDKSVVQEKSAKVKVVMDEWTAKNLQLAVMGL